MLKSLRLTMLLLLTLIVGRASAISTDKLTWEELGIANSTSYSNFDTSGNEYLAADYKGNASSGGGKYIQLRSKKNSGIVTSNTAGKVKSVTIVFNSSTVDGRKVDIYAKHTPYTGASDLYGNDKGTYIGSVTKGEGSNVVTFTSDYEFFGLCSAKNAIYIDEIDVVWDTYIGNLVAPTITGTTPFVGSTKVSITSKDGADIIYTTDGSDPKYGPDYYEDPIVTFTIDKTTTVKAISSYLDRVSPIATKVFTKIETTGQGTKDSPFTVNDAQLILNSGSQSKDMVYVSGTVVSVNKDAEFDEGYLWFSFSQDGSNDNALVAYHTKYLEGTKFMTGRELHAGDKVVVYGKLTEYNDTKEVTNGYVYSVNGKTKSEGTSTLGLSGDGTVDSPYSVADVQKILTAGQEKAAKVYVKGTITNVLNVSTQYGNAEFNMADNASASSTIEAYRMNYLENAKFQNRNLIKTGDNVIVYGQLQTYKSTQEVSNGYIYSLNGNTKDDGSNTSEGTLSADNIAALKALGSGATAKLKLNDVKVTYVNGQKTFLEDNSGAVCLYVSKLGYKAGDVLNGNVTVGYKLYRGLPEISSWKPDGDIAVSQGEVMPTEMTVAECLDESNYCKYVKLVGVTLKDGSAIDGSNSIKLYKKKGWTAPEGKYHVVGIVSVFDSTHELQVISYEAAPEFEDVSFSIDTCGYSTLYYSDRALAVPDGVEAYTYKIVDDVLLKSTTYRSGDVLPNGCAVVVKGKPGTYTLTVERHSVAADADNVLRGTDDYSATEGGSYYYLLSNGSHGVGFYWGAENGSAFTNNAHKAYLPYTPSEGAKAISFFGLDGKTTGINSIKTVSNDDTQLYNLAGQRVSKDYKGVVIMNGRKILNK